MRPDGVPSELRRLPPAATATAAVMIASVASAPAVLRLVGFPQPKPLEHALPWVLMISTALLTSWLAVRAPRATTVKRAVMWCLLGAPSLGVLNVGLSAILLQLSDGYIDQIPQTFILAVTFGSVIGGPAGLLYGVSFLVPVVTGVRGGLVASHAAAEHSLLITGTWLLAVCTIASWVLRKAPLGPALPAALGGVVGLGAACFGLLLTLRRRHWLRRVRQGRVHGWTIEPWDEHIEQRDLRPFMHRERHRCWNVLVRRIDDASPYRAAGDTPFALV